MEKVSKVRRIQRSESEIRAILQEQQTSHLSVKELCGIYKIHEATFYNWRKKYGPLVKNANEFIPMEMNRMDREPSLFAEVELRGRIIVRFFQPVAASYFKALM